MFKSCPISNSQKHRALSARSFGRKCPTAKFFGVRRRALAARGDGRSSIANLEQFITSFCAFVIPSGYRGLASVLQNSPCRVPDVLQISTPRSVSFQALHVLKRSVEIFGNVRKVVGEIRNV